MEDVHRDQLLTPHVVRLQNNFKATLDGWSEKQTYYNRKRKGACLGLGLQTNDGKSGVTPSHRQELLTVLPVDQENKVTTGQQSLRLDSRSSSSNQQLNSCNTATDVDFAKDVTNAEQGVTGSDFTIGDTTPVKSNCRETRSTQPSDGTVASKCRSIARKMSTVTPPVLMVNDVIVPPSNPTGAETAVPRPRRISLSNPPSTLDLDALKAMTSRLNLSTRRPSYVEWHHRYLERGGDIELPSTVVAPPVAGRPGRWSSEKKAEIDDALSRIRKDLIEMRLSDHKLARQLLSLRRDIHQVKLQHSSAQHKVVLEEAFDQIKDERDEIAEVCDLPPDQLSPTLKQFGVTRMNLSTRRFSVF